jgi:hypothetical protein
MSFLTYFFGKGYTGGPDFSKLETLRFDLEGNDLSITIPATNIALPRGEISVNIPFRSPGWFDKHCRQMWNHFYARVFGESWAYVGPFWKAFPDPTFGVLSLSLDIKRVLPGMALEMNNLDTLAEAIHRDYEWYFEEEEPGDYGRGGNRKARQEVEEEYNNRHPSVPEERKRERKEALLKHYLRELPTQFETRRYGDQAWLHYALEREPTYPTHYYCQPLADHYYLYVKFSYRIDLSDYFHLWQADAEAAEQRIIEMVKLTFPNRLQAPDENKAIQTSTSK